MRHGRGEELKVAEDRVGCPQCGRQVVPKLWHVRKMLAYPVIQHVCPFCGVVMYETGGQPRWGCIIAILVAILLLTLPAIITFMTVALRRYP
jgi:uncharacterized paraquat-inducible protein A